MKLSKEVLRVDVVGNSIYQKEGYTRILQGNNLAIKIIPEKGD